MKKLGIVSTALIASFIFAVPGAFAGVPDGNSYIEFSDLTQAPWATNAVTQLSFQGVVKGVGGGLFGPNQQVTRDQALALIARTYGSGSLTMGYAYTDNSLIPAWARDPLAEDVALGVLPGTGTLDPSGEASRAQVVQWTINAMGLGQQAQGVSTQDLSVFSDAAQIPQGDEQDMALAIQMGLMNGVNPNTLDPNGTITRAQIAVVLARAEDLYGLPQNLDTPTMLSGTVISSFGSSLTLALFDGTTQTLTINSACLVYQKNQVSNRSSLTAGERVLVGIDYRGEVQVILSDPTEPPAGDQEFEGTVSAVSDSSITVVGQSGPAGGQGGTVSTTRTFVLDPVQTVVSLYGHSDSIGDIGAGSRVDLITDLNGNAISVTVQATQMTASGELQGQSGSEYVLLEAPGNALDFTMGSNVKVIDSTGTVVSASQVVLGDTVTVSGELGEEGLKVSSIIITKAVTK